MPICQWVKCDKGVGGEPREFEPSKVGGTVVFWQKYCSKGCATAARNQRARDKVKRAMEIAARVEGGGDAI
jgi:hypothetical protein